MYRTSITLFCLIGLAFTACAEGVYDPAVTDSPRGGGITPQLAAGARDASLPRITDPPRERAISPRGEAPAEPTFGDSRGSTPESSTPMSGGDASPDTDEATGSGTAQEAPNDPPSAQPVEARGVDPGDAAEEDEAALNDDDEHTAFDGDEEAPEESREEDGADEDIDEDDVDEANEDDEAPTLDDMPPPEADPGLRGFLDRIDDSAPGNWTIHDPTRIVEIDGHLMIGVTGKEQADGYDCGLETWYMADGDTEWRPGQCLLRDKPAWLAEEGLEDNDGAFWAPAFLDERTLYYAVSSGFDDGDITCIGVAHAEGEAPWLRWEDSGFPITCSFDAEEEEGPMPSSIDPSVYVDGEGQSWLAFGGGHIYATPVDDASGVPLDEEWFELGVESYHHLANGPALNDEGEPEDDLWVEAPFMVAHGEFVYLFVNWRECCNGAESTYEIRVGRARTVTGPFLDREGRSLLDGGGTLLLGARGERLGPGHAGIFRYQDAAGEITEVFTYHYYPQNGAPWATIGMNLLVWEAGWPRVTDTRFDPAHYWDR